MSDEKEPTEIPVKKLQYIDIDQDLYVLVPETGEFDIFDEVKTVDRIAALSGDDIPGYFVVVTANHRFRVERTGKVWVK